MNGSAAGAGGCRRRGTGLPALALLRLAGLIACFTVATCVSVSGRPDEKLPVTNPMTFPLSKEFFALSKVHCSLSKVFRVRALGRQLPLHQRGRGTSLCGIFWTRRAPTASRRRGSLTIEKGLQVTPQGEVVATIQASASWMLELGKAMWDLGLDNSSAVLIGAQEQLIALDESPRARVGETIQDPCTNEFPVKLYRASKTVLRTRPTPASLTSSTRTWGQSSATRSPSPLCLASEGPN